MDCVTCVELCKKFRKARMLTWQGGLYGHRVDLSLPRLPASYRNSLQIKVFDAKLHRSRWCDSWDAYNPHRDEAFQQITSQATSQSTLTLTSTLDVGRHHDSHRLCLWKPRFKLRGAAAAQRAPHTQRGPTCYNYGTGGRAQPGGGAFRQALRLLTYLIPKDETAT